MSDRLYRKSGSKVWYGWFYVGRQRHVVCTRQTDRKLGLKELQRLAREAHGEGRTAASAPPHSLSQALAHWFAEGMGPRAQATVDFYRKTVAHPIRLLGAHDVNALTEADVLAYLQKRREEGAHSHTLQKEMVALRQALAHAKQRGDMVNDPRALVPKMRSGYVPRKRWLTLEEFELLVESFKRPHRRAWIIVAVYVGGRKSEIERLRRDQVDVDTGWSFVDGTKTTAAKRHVPIHPQLAQLLPQIPVRRDGLLVGPWPGIVEDLKKKCIKLGIPKVNTNDLRRTFASWMAQRKVPLKVIAKLLGHSSTAMVDKVYGHLEDAQLLEAVKLLPSRRPRVVANGKRTPAKNR